MLSGAKDGTLSVGSKMKIGIILDKRRASFVTIYLWAFNRDLKYCDSDIQRKQSATLLACAFVSGLRDQ